jgi:DNA modification methylase
MTRRALTQTGGRVEIWDGSAALGDLLQRALLVDPAEDSVMQHVHGFHSYPARMHPETARRLVQGLSHERDLVLDPFCGSGTVLVESRLCSRRAFGVDANPLAVALARLKTEGIDATQHELFLGAAEAIADHADGRRCSKAGPSRPYSQYYRDAFDPHVLLELDGLMLGIEQACPPNLKLVMKLVISSMINKVSRRRSDTSRAEVQRRIASGFVLRFFVKKARELFGRLDEFRRRLPAGSSLSNAVLGDARALPLDASTVSCIVTSPPYPGIYDYVEHHRLRLDWLKLDARHLERHEIGAHRHFARNASPNAEVDWAAQLGACLDQMARVLTPSGTAAILIADSAVAGKAWYAEPAVRQLSSRHGLRVVAGASQARQHFHAPTKDAFRKVQRREHLILLRRDPAVPGERGPNQVKSSGKTRANRGPRKRG